jgi:hypothetical protein
MSDTQKAEIIREISAIDEIVHIPMNADHPITLMPIT